MLQLGAVAEDSLATAADTVAMAIRSSALFFSHVSEPAIRVEAVSDR